MSEIAQCGTARKFFDTLNGKPISKVAELFREYGEPLEQKRAYQDRQRAAPPCEGRRGGSFFKDLARHYRGGHL